MFRGVSLCFVCFSVSCVSAGLQATDTLGHAGMNFFTYLDDYPAISMTTPVWFMSSLYPAVWFYVWFMSGYVPVWFMSGCFFFFQHNFCVKPYVPREPQRDPSNRRLCEHGIYIRHCQESNSQPVPSQAGADTLGHSDGHPGFMSG